MFPLYCNNCFRHKRIESNLQLYLNQCAHIVCKECMKNVCAICNRPWKPQLIDNSMSTSMAVFFEDPLKMYKRFQSVIKFQTYQQTRYISNLLQKMPPKYQKAEREYDGFRKLDARLSADMERERKRADKMETYLTYYKRVLQQRSTNRSPKNSTQSKRNDSAYYTQIFSKGKRPQTPTISTTNSNSLSNSSGNCSHISSINSKNKNIFTSTRKSNDFGL